jgi:hypothetical protein
MSVHLPSRLLELIGAVAVGSFVVGLILEAFKGKKDRPRDVPLATSHPAVPTNLFSSTFERQSRADLRRYNGDRWLLAYGDKVCQSTLSLLLCISQGANLPSSDSETRKGLFALYLQAAMAETRLQMVSSGRSTTDADGLMNCIGVTILETPLGKLDRYTSLLSLGEDERRDTVAQEAVRRLGAPNDAEQHFSSAYVLLRTVTTMLVLNR